MSGPTADRADPDVALVLRSYEAYARGDIEAAVAPLHLARVSKDLEAPPVSPQLQWFSIFRLAYYPRQRWGAYLARSKIL